MASTKTKTVEYEIRGNTVNLEQTINGAISSLDALEAKLLKMSTLGKTSGGMKRATGITSAINTVQDIRTSMADMPAGVTVAQVNLLNTAEETLAKTSSKLSTQISGTSKSMKTLNKTLSGVKTGMETIIPTTSRFGTSMVKAFTEVLNPIMLLRRALILLFQKIVEGVQAAADLVETTNLFNVSCGEAAETLGEFSTAFADAFSVDISDVLEYVGTFNLLSKSLGATVEQAAILGENVTALTYDLSSLFNVDFETMFTAVKSGMTGISKPMKKYGIVINETVIKQKAAMLGIEDSWDDMTEVDKMGLRYIVMLEQSSAAQGDFAKTLESPLNQFKVMKAQFGILFRHLGELVMILGTVVMPIINGFTKALNGALEVLTKAAGYTIEDFTDNLSASTDVIDDETASVDDLADSLKNVLMPFDEFNMLSDNSDDALIAYEMDPAIAAALEGYDNLMDQISTKADQLGEIFMRIWNPDLIAIFGNIVKAVFSVFSFGLDLALDALNLLAYPVKWLTDALVFLLTPLTALYEGWNSADKATRGWAIAGTVALGVLGALILAMKAYNYVSLLGNGILKDGIKFLYEYISLQLKDIAVKIKSIAIKIKDTIATKAAAVAEWWHNASLAAKIMLLSAGAAIAVVIGAGIASAIMSNKAKQAEASVPAMATGGVVGSSTVALIGEGRYSEAVVPLGASPQFAAMKEDIASEVASRIGSTGNSGNTSIRIFFGQQEFKAFTYDLVNDENRRRTGLTFEKISNLNRR